MVKQLRKSWEEKNGQKRSLYSLDNFVYNLRCVLEKMHLILELV